MCFLLFSKSFFSKKNSHLNPGFPHFLSSDEKMKLPRKALGFRKKRNNGMPSFSEETSIVRECAYTGEDVDRKSNKVSNFHV